MRVFTHYPSSSDPVFWNTFRCVEGTVPVVCKDSRMLQSVTWLLWKYIYWRKSGVAFILSHNNTDKISTFFVLKPIQLNESRMLIVNLSFGSLGHRYNFSNECWWFGLPLTEETLISVWIVISYWWIQNSHQMFYLSVVSVPICQIFGVRTIRVKSVL